MNELDPNAQPPNPYPWLKPMPVMWLCVIICIALIVLGTWMSRQKVNSPVDPPTTEQKTPGSATP